MRRLLHWFVFILCPWAIALGTARSQTAADCLTNAASILALPEGQADGRPVLLHGVVTAAESNWYGRFFIQDASGGVFVDNNGQSSPAIGDSVEVAGFSFPGGFAPCISRPSWKKIRTAELPEARQESMDRILSGAADGLRVKVTGWVREVHTKGSSLVWQVVSDGQRLKAFSPLLPEFSPDALIGARIELRGTLAASFNSPLRHMLTVALYVPRPADVQIFATPGVNPFQLPLTPLNRIAQYRHDALPGQPIHVQGIVTQQHPGEALYVEDETGGLEILSPRTDLVKPGTRVDIVGFPALKNYLPVLEDAVFRPLGSPGPPRLPRPAALENLKAGRYHAEYVTLTGRLVDRWNHRPPLPGGHSPGLTLWLQNSNLVFTAEAETLAPNNPLLQVQPGSRIEISGVCRLDSNEKGQLESLRLQLQEPVRFRVLDQPDWLTPRRLGICLGAAVLVLLAVAGWNIFIVGKNRQLEALMREREAARNALQAAHDQLEQRIQERTAQLKVEMTARKESELQFRAGLTERTRLAQELHDTLEQTLTGIRLQIDLVKKHFETKPETARHHLMLADGLMRQSQLDVRRSVWGLRIRAEEQFNLFQAIKTSAAQMATDTGLTVQTIQTGEARTLPEVIEENLLRISQEAMTNVVKHSGARNVGLELSFLPGTIRLEIRDDGAGFEPDRCQGPQDGHFGLQGMRERTERMGGQLRLVTEPGRGTTIRVEVPVTELHAT